MLKDRVQETTVGTGTGNLTLDGAVPGYTTFNAAFTVGSPTTNLFFYTITQGDTMWETGVGYLSAATTLVRSVIIANYLGTTAAVAFTGTAAKYVFNTPPADRFTNWRGQNLEQPAILNYTERINAMGAGAGTPRNIDLSLGNVVTATKTGNTTWAFTNVPSIAGRAVSFTLVLTNGGVGTTTWPIAVKWSYTVVPTLSAAGTDILTFMTVDNGTTWHGMLASFASS